MSTNDRSGDADRRALLELLLADEGLRAPRRGIPRRKPEDPPTLSFAQERIWFLDQYETDTAVLALRAAIRLRGALDVAALRHSLDAIVARHEVLRTLIVSAAGEPRPVVLPTAPTALHFDDLEDNPARLESLLLQESNRTFDLTREAPMHVRLIRLSADEHVLSVVMHHVASDGWSLRLFFRELGQLYADFSRGVEPSLPELSIEYQDYAHWQRRSGSEAFADQLDYWRRQLAHPLPVFEIPPDFVRPARHTYDGGQVSHRLSPAATEALHHLGRRSGSTMFMTMLAAFEIVASRHAGSADVMVGTPIAGRVRPELESLVGVFLNTLVLRTDLSGNPSFNELLSRVRNTSLDAFDHQDVPFEQLLNVLQPTRDISRTPLFQILFNVMNFGVEGEAITWPTVDFELIDAAEPGSKFDLTVYVTDTASAANIQFVYNSRLYRAETMQHLLDQFVSVLEQVVADPDRPILDYSLVTASAASVLPNVGEPLSTAWYGSVPDAIVSAAERTPDRVAIDDGTQHLTYGALAEQMCRVAGWLRSRGVQPGEIVAIYAHRTPSLAVAVTGVLASGAAYMLLDPKYPPARLIQYLRIARPVGWLSLDAAGVADPGLLEVLDELGVHVRLRVPREFDEAFVPSSARPPDLVLPHPAAADDAACLTFTSGSTGRPKAVVGRHGSLTHFFPWMSEQFHVTEKDRFSMLSGLAHDPIQRDLFWPFWLGATVVVPDGENIATPGWVRSWMQRERITVAHLTPAMGQLIAEPAASGESVAIASLRRAFVIGDVLTRRDVARLRGVAPEVEIVNLYGATETQRASAFHVVSDVDDGLGTTKEVLPLGRSMPGTQVMVLTPMGASAGVGEIGDLVFRGAHLAIGYLDDAALTGQRFGWFQRSTSSFDRTYTTGDRGRFDSHGRIEFIGRSDEQVQVRGFRIELGEVQATIARHPHIRDAVVQVRTRNGESRLVAYVVPTAADAGATATNVRQFLRDELPAHMVPADIIAIDRVPLTPNGKVDHSALTAIEQGRSVDLPVRTPRDPLERTLAAIWADVLNLKSVAIDDDFFAIGGYSLLATRVFAFIEQQTGHRLPVSMLFESPTIAELAEAIRRGDNDSGWSSLVPIQTHGHMLPLFYVTPYTISVLQIAQLGNELGRDQPLYGLQPQGLDGRHPPHHRIEEMAAHYIEEMKTVQAHGPYSIGGHCSGAWVAFEMARQLESSGDVIGSIVLIDQGPPGVERPRINPMSYVVNRLRFYLRDRRLRHSVAWQVKIALDRYLLRRVGGTTTRSAETVKETHREAFRRYAGGMVTHDLILVRSAESRALEDKTWFVRWADRTEGTLTTVDVSGTHANLLVQPFVAELAREVAHAIDPSLHADRCD